MLEPLGEVGANFSLQLSSRTQFTKINNKKVIAKNQCEKHKKSSLSDILCSLLKLQSENRIIAALAIRFYRFLQCNKHYTRLNCIYE